MEERLVCPALIYQFWYCTVASRLFIKTTFSPYQPYRLLIEKRLIIIIIQPQPVMLRMLHVTCRYIFGSSIPWSNLQEWYTWGCMFLMLNVTHVFLDKWTGLILTCSSHPKAKKKKSHPEPLKVWWIHVGVHKNRLSSVTIDHVHAMTAGLMQY